MKRLAIFASGSGSNAEQITNHFHNQGLDVCVELIMTNKPDAYVLARAKKLGVESQVFNRDTFYHSNDVIALLQDRKIDLVVLAGFLWLVPQALISAFPDRIINIHPALLPKYGGKGMYGSNVHKAVVANKETESGITIHLVDEIYDNGTILRQEKCEVSSADTAEQVAQKIHRLEYEYFPLTIEEYLAKI
ncbi:phosphoribosylglycinamide formyltransferase [Reichenbachiella carrageenanivorans]|uniref:Phosphoribosylglycinamide formyltransferase n=1 Tax=Reichenbachiella carrageenanivorans TaxID=2979869 RepID=A0ABY6D232_9BACT|nr:phosphoribosylglycinamide formyltransferase [Reichenbachiella carrageenanivorans]UXX80216.1 phosphoribosylglycinamide formyltransferase [Reichenbachiella carrageenanivorans]